MLPLVVNSVADRADASPGNGICSTGITLPSGQAECTLRAAANEASGRPGTSSTIAFDSSTNGQRIVLGSAVTLARVNLVGNGRTATIVDGGGRTRVFYVPAATNIEISGMTITNGAADYGGALYFDGTWSNYWQGRETSATINDTEISSNTASAGGGAIYLVLTNLTINNSIVSRNSSTTGGAVLMMATLNINNSTFSDNTASGGAGAIFANNGTRTAYINIDSSTFSGNRASLYGGAIFMNTGGQIKVVNSTLSGNRAGTYGGAIGGNPTAFTIVSSTIIGNTVDSDAAGVHAGGVQSSGAAIAVRNSIIAGNRDNSAGSPRPDCSGSISSSGYNVIGDATGCTYSGGPGDRIGTSASPIDPKLDPVLKDNGGPTFTHALLGGSPAVNLVPLASCRGLNGAPLATDQRGSTRPQPAGANCDSGAFEASDTTPPVTSASLSGSIGNNGWYSSAVEVNLTSSDEVNGSGVKEIHYQIGGNAVVVVSGSTANLTNATEGETTVNFWSVDNAGNRESPKSVNLAIDKTPPTITGNPTTAPNINGWYRGTVTIHFTCTDALSGIATCPADVTLSANGANQSISATATDNAGNAKPVTVSGINIDLTAPSIEGSRGPTANSAGWNNTDVTVSFTCADALSAIQSCGPTQIVSSDGANQSRTGTAVDAAGNERSLDVTNINVDKTAPTVSISTVTSAPNGFLPAQTFTSLPATVGSTSVTLAGVATDGLSGVSSVLVNGMPATLGSGTWSATLALVVGPNTINVVGSDAAGNPKTLSGVVTLNLDLDGDGIANSLDGSCSGAGEFTNPSNNGFSDKVFGGATCGTIITRNGYPVTITDAPSPSGVNVVVGTGGTGKLQISLEKKSSVIKLSAGSYVLTDPDQTIAVQATGGGTAEINLTLNGSPLLVLISDGGHATIVEGTDSGGNLVKVQVSAVSGSVTLNGMPLVEGQSLTIGRLESSLELNGNRFNLQATLSPGLGSNGLDLISEALRLKVGAYSVVIPTVSFKAAGNKQYNIQSTIGETKLVGQIRALPSGAYSVHVEGQGAQLAGTTNPPTVGILIGDDIGFATVEAKPK